MMASIACRCHTRESGHPAFGMDYPLSPIMTKEGVAGTNTGSFRRHGRACPGHPDQVSTVPP
jgi:hypothetical protein